MTILTLSYQFFICTRYPLWYTCSHCKALLHWCWPTFWPWHCDLWPFNPDNPASGMVFHNKLLFFLRGGVGGAGCLFIKLSTKVILMKFRLHVILSVPLCWWHCWQEKMWMFSSISSMIIFKKKTQYNLQAVNLVSTKKRLILCDTKPSVNLPIHNSWSNIVHSIIHLM